jgi:hypothetical protein
MMSNVTSSQFKARLLRPEKADGKTPWAFAVLPKSASAKLPRRGRTTVEGTINHRPFQATLEPDGQLSHWMRVDKELLESSGVHIGDVVEFEIAAVEQEPEPDVPTDLQEALDATPEAQSVWNTTTSVARLDWIHWITSAKQTKTRAKRIADACDMLASGKRRVCCFDSSGYYSKAFRAPAEADSLRDDHCTNAPS